MTEKNNEEEILTALRLLDIQTVATGEGEFEFQVQVSEEFETWFKKEQSLSRWSEKRFSEWFRSVIGSELPRVHAEILGKVAEMGEKSK